MVFHSVSEAQTPPPMASAFSLKSQHLHYFPLSDLRWSMNHSDAHTLRWHPDPSNLSPFGNHRSALKLGDGVVQSPDLPSSSSSLGKNENRLMKLAYPTVKSSRSGNSDRDNPVGTGHLIEKADKSATVKSTGNLEKKMVSSVQIVEKKDEKLNGSKGQSKLYIRLPARTKATADITDTVDETECAVKDKEPAAKPWNLRPRRSLTKHPDKNEGASKHVVAPLEGIKSKVKIQPQFAVPAEKFSATLSKKEIEKDFLLMTGSKPPGRPKKRARNVQKQIDCLYPGLCLTSVTPDLYEVPDTRHKG